MIGSIIKTIKSCHEVISIGNPKPCCNIKFIGVAIIPFPNPVNAIKLASADKPAKKIMYLNIGGMELNQARSVVNPPRITDPSIIGIY